MHLGDINTFQQGRTGCWLLLQCRLVTVQPMAARPEWPGGPVWIERDHSWGKTNKNLSTQHKKCCFSSFLLAQLYATVFFTCHILPRLQEKKTEQHIPASLPLPPLQKTNGSSDVRAVSPQPLQSWQCILQQPKVRALHWEPLQKSTALGWVSELSAGEEGLDQV